MMTVKEVSKLAGVSIRTLRYYDRIGLLTPSEYTGGGYRLYDESALERLQQILLFREVRFSLKEIAFILKSPDFDRTEALKRQIELLTVEREHLDKLIAFARGLIDNGGNTMDFSAFDTTKREEYARQAKEKWGHTDAYKEFESGNAGRTIETEEMLARGLMDIFKVFGACREDGPASPRAQETVKRLKSYITEHYYTCTDTILLSLGEMYTSGGEFTENIDKAGGSGTAELVKAAIDICCK